MFSTTAYAQASNEQAAYGGSSDVLIQIMPFVLIFVVFYFLLLRPQQVKMKQQKVMLDNLQQNDQVVTAGGIVGRIRRVIDENEVMVEIADNVQVRVLRSTVSALYEKVTDASAAEMAGAPRGDGTKSKRIGRKPLLKDVSKDS